MREREDRKERLPQRRDLGLTALRLPAGGAWLRATVCKSTPDDATIVCEATLRPDQDLVLGSDSSASLVVPDWTGPNVLVISSDGHLHLAPGMRVNMCARTGGMHLIATYEELLERGTTLPIPIMGRRMNIRVSAGLSVFAKYVTERGEELERES